jgi:hypothetical protein
MRNIFETPEFEEFLENSNTNVQIKIKYILDVLITQYVINTKIVKKLVNTDFYEIRMQIDNEYRIICFAIDHENIMQSKNILILNGFLKKSTKDYDKQIKKATKILEQWKDQN